MKKYWLIFFLLIMALPIFAYIDPMSGSTILYLIIGLFSAMFYGLRGFFYRLVNLWKGRGFVTGDSIKGCDIVIYSEGKQYWHIFKPIVDSLVKRGISCAYLSSDQDDKGLEYESDLVYKHYLGGIAQSFSYLNNLKAKFVLMTTPQLDIMTLKRSKGVKHYCHVLHSPTDIHSYRKFGFDYFDSVMCSGSYQIKSLRTLENYRGSKRKLLLETGLTYFDVMLDGFTGKKIQSKTGLPVVLVAPTWQPYCILNRFGSKLIKNLLDSGLFEVILRPHPQSYISFPKVILDLQNEFDSNLNFTLDKNASGINSLNRADIMISDISGVAFDYAFIQNKPVVFFDVPFTGKGMEASNIEHTPWDMDVRELLGALVSEDDLNEISSVVKNILDEGSSSKLNKLRDDSMYNFGTAGSKAAEQILEILEGINVS